MSVEEFLAKQQNNPRRFNDVVRKLLSGEEPQFVRQWKWEREIPVDHIKTIEQYAYDGLGYIDSSTLFYLKLLGINEVAIAVYEKYIYGGTGIKVTEQRKFDDCNATVKRRLAGILDISNDKFNDIDILANHLYQRISIDPITAAEIGAYIRLHWSDWEFDGDWDILSKVFAIPKDFLLQTEVYVRFAADLRILAAYKVQMTDKGIEIIDDAPNTGLDIHPPPRPIRRKI